MKILIVDDWEQRHTTIADGLGGRGKRHEFRSEYGPAWVTDEDLAWADAVFLDHDMCQTAYDSENGIWYLSGTLPCPCPVSGGANALDPRCGCPTGMDLVKRMIALPHRPKALVHTANSVAGPEMVRKLSEAGFDVTYIPALAWPLHWGRVEKWLTSTSTKPDSAS